MKKITLLAILAIAAFSNNANAQSSATATATATIVTPIGITKDIDMSFGNIAVTGTAGTVILSTADARTTTGGVTLPNVKGIVSAASFDVTGTGGYTYMINIPATIELKHTNNTDVMSVTNINNSVGATGALDAKGTQNIKVGGTLNVASSQLAGVYSNAAALVVTVNYN